MGQGFVLLSGQADTCMAHMNGQIKVPACIGVDCGAETLSSKMIGGVLLCRNAESNRYSRYTNNPHCTFDANQTPLIAVAYHPNRS
jgi:hypothetical protein